MARYTNTQMKIKTAKTIAYLFSWCKRAIIITLHNVPIYLASYPLENI